jgi:hypothetical protein
MTALAQIETRPIVYVAIYKPSKSAPKVVSLRPKMTPTRGERK